jgi:transposase
MRIANLPRKAVDRLRRSYKQTKSPKEKERYHALWLKARGYKREEICELLGIGSRTLGRWIQKYNRSGLTSLQDKPQFGNHRNLSNKQKDQVKQLIHQKKPDDLGYRGKFWDIGILKRLVKDKFGVMYKSQTSYRVLFKWCGFSYHKPDKVNKKQSVKSIKDWEKKIKKDWRGIAQEMGWYW